jgi:regulation of enolase protein 1 (concanavalin A-like superfamily)
LVFKDFGSGFPFLDSFGRSGLDWISFVADTKMEKSTPREKLFRLTFPFTRRKKIIPDEYFLNSHLKNAIMRTRSFSRSPFCLILVLGVLSLTGTMAQNTDSLRLPFLPRPLFWENTPLKFHWDSTHLVIESGGLTDMFRDPNVTYNTDNAPKLLFVADSNFVLTASIHHIFFSKWDGGAIVLKADSLNWIKFCFEKDYTGQHRVVSVVTKGISDDCNSAPVSGNTVFYKVAKAGNVITLYYSLEGRRWFLIRHLVFDSQTPLKVGFLAQSPTGKSCTVTFSNIHYSARKIRDPYLGE